MDGVRIIRLCIYELLIYVYILLNIFKTCSFQNTEKPALNPDTVLLVSATAIFENVTAVETEVSDLFEPIGSTIQNADYVYVSANSIPTDITSTDDHEKRRIPLYLGAYFPFGGGWDGSGVIPAVQMALDHINAREDILENYELRMVLNDTQCQAGLGTRVLFDQLFKKPTKIMLFGGGCSTATQAIAATSYHWNLVTMSYAASSPALSDRKAYPFFYRVVMPDSRFNPARIKLMKEFGWNRVATLHENQELFSLAIDDLITLLKEANITLITSESFAENPKNQVENIKNQDAKIIVVNMYQPKARKVFCEAYNLGMTGEGYAWLIVGWYSVGWYLEEDDSIECSKEEMKLAVEGAFYIAIESLHISTSDKPTISGITAAEFVAELIARLEWPENHQYQWNNRNPYGYDAMWAVALMLNQSVETLKTKRFSDNKTRRLEDFTYDDHEMALMFLDLLKDIHFDGVSGSVSFLDGDRIDSVRIEQLRGSCEEGWYHHGSDCFSFRTDSLPFNLANDHCHGGYLACITSNEEQEFVVDTWRKWVEHGNLQSWYIGLLWNGNEFTWLDNRVDDVSWFPDQNDLTSPPLNQEFCVSIDFSNNAKWTATNCSESLPYICRKPEAFLEKQIGLYSPNGEDGTLEWYENVTWPGGKVPLDHTPEIVVTVIRIHEGVDWYLYTAMCLLAGIGIFLALLFLSFNIYYRKQKFVRMSSPNLNNLILLGGIMVYSSIFFAGLDSTLVSENLERIACQIHVWVFSVGFVVAFGSMFSKTWRVHKVAAFKKPKRRIITDNQLFIMVFVLFAVDVVILTVWQIVDPLKVSVRDLLEREDPDVANQRLIPYIKRCTCDLLLYWLIPLYAYKGLLLVFGTFLAWETRRVSIPALNDSKLIGISVYNVVILCVIGLSVSFIISDDPSARYIFTSCIIIFCASTTLLVVFVPKIISVMKYPKGEPVSTMKGRTNTGGTMDSIQASSLLIEENRQLKERLKQVESELDQRKLNGSTHYGHCIKSPDQEQNCSVCVITNNNFEDTSAISREGTESHGLQVEMEGRESSYL